jgi:penicillin-binding protein 2
MLKLKDYIRETSLIQSRLIAASVVMVVLSLSLLLRLYYLQVTQHQHYATLSQDNRIRLVPIPPVRGQIYDRHGTILAENLPVYTLEVTPDRVSDMDGLLDRVGRLVELTDADLERFADMLRTRPSFETQTLKAGLSDDEVARFAVNQHLFDGVDLRARLQRYYPLGEDMVHVLGYVGRISEADLDTIDRSAYRGTDYIGKLGIEARYEERLLGKVGYEKVETNAHGRIVRTLERTSPRAGRHVYLNIDSGLQRAARDYLGEFEGSVVAMEPATGAVLAFVSNPVYDPNPFVNGIDTKSYRALRESDSRPLLNRALNGRYAPGSTIKPVFGLAALEHQRHPGHGTFCPGFFRLKGSTHRYRCWKRQGHGTVALRDAIVQSCDVYFYQLSHSLGIDNVSEFMLRFGFGKPTGVDLDGEPGGLVPSRQWKRRVRRQPWYPGETVITGIGQGYTLATPIQMATITATLANRGLRMRPRLVAVLEDPQSRERDVLEPEVLEQVPLRSDGFYDLVISAMRDVVHSRRGTARASGRGAEYQFAGKTGTAQVIGIAQGARYDEEKIAKKFRDHSLFIAFAPVENPKIAVVVIAENGGGGSRTAAPIARKVMDYYLVGPPPPPPPEDNNDEA